MADLRTSHRYAQAERLDDLLVQLMDDGAGRVGTYDRRRRAFALEGADRFCRRAGHLALRLRAAGVTGGVPVFVGCPAPVDAWTGYLAVVLAGGLPAIGPVRPAFDGRAAAAARIRDLVDSLGAGARVLTSAAGARYLPDELAADAIDLTDAIDPADHVDLTDGERAPHGVEVPAGLEPGGGDPDAPVHLQFTSGSTGRPKVIAVSHRNLLANSAVVADILGTERGGTLVSWLPLYHDMGLVAGAVASLVHGVDHLLQSPFDFLGDPLSWLRAVSDHRATATLAPNVGFEAIVERVGPDELRAAGLDLSAWRSAACGGEPPRPATLAAFARRLEPFGFDPRALAPGYGLAEATVAVCGTPTGVAARRLVVTRESLDALGRVDVRYELDVDGTTVDLDDALAEVCSSGPLHPDVGVRLVDEHGVEVVGDDRCGEIVVDGPSVTRGVREPDGTITPFGTTGPTGLATGDVGFVHDGWLYVVERLRNIVVRHGRNHAAAVLEEALASAVGVSPERVAVLDTAVDGGRGGVVAVVEDDRRTVPDEVVRLARERIDRLPLPPDEVIVVPSGSLPRTTSGKKRHVDIRRALRDDDLRVLRREPLVARPAPRAALPAARDRRVEPVVLGLVEQLVRERGATTAIGLDARLADDLLLDSVAVYELALATEEALDVTIAEAELVEVVTVGDLCALASRTRSAAGARPGRDAGGVRGAVERFGATLPNVHLTVERQEGRRVLIDGRWFDDFASCNYLGLDLHPAVADAVPPMLHEWGVHPSWTRAVASPEPYRRLEAELAALVGSEDAVVFPTVTLLHLGVLPRLVGRGTLLVDSAAHHSAQEAATLARARGAGLRTWPHGDLASLERALDDERDATARVIVVDGVYSMSGAHLRVAALAELAARHDAIVYVDDAHGFGVLGHDPSEGDPYGVGGGGVLRHAGADPERFVYVGGLSKALSSMAAFVTTSADGRPALDLASTVVFSGPVPVASLATSLAGLAVGATEGGGIRRRLAALTGRLVDGVTELGLEVDAGPSGRHSGFPIVNVVIGRPEEVSTAARIMWEASVLVTPSAFPAAPLDRGGVRLTVTAANTEDEVARALAALGRVRDAVPTATVSR